MSFLDVFVSAVLGQLAALFLCCGFGFFGLLALTGVLLRALFGGGFLLHCVEHLSLGGICRLVFRGSFRSG